MAWWIFRSCTLSIRKVGEALNILKYASRKHLPSAATTHNLTKLNHGTKETLELCLPQFECYKTLYQFHISLSHYFLFHLSLHCLFFFNWNLTKIVCIEIFFELVFKDCLILVITFKMTCYFKLTI